MSHKRELRELPFQPGKRFHFKKAVDVEGVQFAAGADGVMGDVEMLPDVKPTARLRISIMIPEDVLEDLRKIAADEGLPYQTLINQILRNAVNGVEPVHQQLDRIEKMIAALKKAS